MSAGLCTSRVHTEGWPSARLLQDGQTCPLLTTGVVLGQAERADEPHHERRGVEKSPNACIESIKKKKKN